MSCAQQDVNVDMRNAIHPVQVSLQIIYTHAHLHGVHHPVQALGFTVQGLEFGATEATPSWRAAHGEA